MNDLEQAKQVFQSDSYAFVLVNGGRVVATGRRDGIGELLEAMAAHPDARGASLADKVVGKAVALVAVAAGICAVYSPLVSAAAQRVLAANHIPLQAERMVPLIRNKHKDGPCPMERLTQPIDDPTEAVRALGDFVRARAAVHP